MSLSPFAPRGFRLHIGLFGRRNVGKSSLLNALTGHPVSIVSPEPGTTTDSVNKTMELRPLGPVLFIDTAGLDDEGALGAARVRRAHRSLQQADLALWVTDTPRWSACERRLLEELRDRRVPVVMARNKCDLGPDEEPHEVEQLSLQIPTVRVSATTGEGLDELRDAIISSVPDHLLHTRALVGDLLPPGGVAVLVVPIDLAAPKGRLILPQVNTLRDLLDHDAIAMVVKEGRLADVMARLTSKPDLVVTDSQAFRQVAQSTPEDVNLTSFSVLFSRFRGDLLCQAQGALAVDSLQSGDRILVAEACAHHPVLDDIGRVKLPKWLRERTGVTLHFDTVQGRDFPADLSPYRLVIHCGACVWNRRSMLHRIALCQRASVPITNYGLVIAQCLGILSRALEPFPEARSVCRPRSVEHASV